MIANIVVATAAFVALQSCPGGAASCSQGAQSDVSFSITGRRNLTGHWIVQVGGRQPVAGAGVEVGPWQLDVHALTPLPCDDTGALQLQASLTVAPSAARPGYELRPALGSRYKLHLRAVAWEEARRACAAEGAHLAVVGGDAEAAALQKLFARHPNITNTTWAGAAWVGFHDQHTEGEYLTVLGRRVEESGYNKWVPGQPDNRDYKMAPDVDSDCGGIHRSALLDDLPCSAKYAFICEQELW